MSIDLFPFPTPPRTVSVDDEMTKRGYSLCAEFLGGAWACCNAEDFHIREIRYVVLILLITESYVVNCIIECLLYYGDPNEYIILYRYYNSYTQIKSEKL